MPRLPALALLLAAATLPLSADPGPAAPPSPEAFFGHTMGADRRLPTWDRTVDYLHAVARASDRVVVEQAGLTTRGRPYLAVVVSAPETLRTLDEVRTSQRRLADPRTITSVDAERLARDGKAIVVVGAGVHSTETGGTQALAEVIWRLGTEQSDATRHLLDNLVMVFVPSQNPDGQQLLAEWHAANQDTPFEDAPLPELYHAYAGHDNNRDAFMQNLAETRHLSRLLYREWLPEVYLDLHQMGPSRARVFVPPYRSPVNPNVDPLVWTQANLLGQTMASRLIAAGKRGVVWGETYSGYWQGANSTTPWWHNIVGMLSEVASARPAAALDQAVAHAAPGSLDPPRGRAGLSPQLAAPPDTQYRMNYPEPWLGGRWTPRDVVEHHVLATLGLLEGAANNRVLLKRNFHAMHRRAVERFSAGPPWAFAVPKEQRDPAAADRLVAVLMAGGAEMHLVRRGAGRLEPGDRLALLAQPFGRWVKDLLEPQVYPDARPAPADRPYDLTGWTLGLQMGVAVERLDAPVDAGLTLLHGAPARKGSLAGRGPVALVPPYSTASAAMINRLWAAGASIGWSRGAALAEGLDLPPGTAVVRGVPRAALDRLAAETGVDVLAVAEADAPPAAAARRPRVAVVEPWGGLIDAGWTRYVLEQHHFAYERVRPGELQDSDRLAGFDAVVVPDMTSELLLGGLTGRHVRPEHRGGLGERGVAALKHWVHAGGTVVTLGNSAQFAIDHLDVPAVVAARADEADKAFVPGALLSGRVADGHPIAAGLPSTIALMNVMNHGYRPGRGAEGLRSLVTYPEEPLTLSGLAPGEARLRGTLAAFDTAMGRGRVVVIGFRPQHRAQTWGTFKLLFNALYLAGRLQPEVEPTVDQ